MNFTFRNEDGEIVRDILKCQHCGHIQIRRHFGEDGRCPLCQHESAEKIDTQTRTPGMSNLQYRKLLDALETVSGVGEGTIESIQDEFEQGDDFVDACSNAYDEQAYDELTPVSGVGEATARKIALKMADMKDWEDGLAESEFTFVSGKT